MKERSRLWAAWTALIVDSFILLSCRPPLTRLIAGVASPRALLVHVGADRAMVLVAGSILWLVGLWLGAGLLATLVAVAGGRGRGTAARLSVLMTPAAIRRLVIASTSVSLTLAVSGTVASPPARAASPSAPRRLQAAALASDRSTGHATDPGPVARRPTVATTTEGPAGTGTAGLPHGLGPRSQLPTPLAPTDPAPDAPRAEVVRPGDSL